MAERIDLTGGRYGRLTVISKAESAGGRVQWICQCDCGNEVIVAAYRLKANTTKSCGCLKTDRNKERGSDLTGQNFGELTVLRYSHNDPVNRGPMWLCRCSCGNEKAVHGYALKQGNYKSCGCKRADKLKSGVKKHIQKDRVDGTRKTALTAKLHVNNSSGVKGVRFNQQRGKWTAHIGFKGKQISLGYYAKFEDAVAARKAAEEKYFNPILGVDRD
jgi:hypothetical protein